MEEKNRKRILASLYSGQSSIINGLADHFKQVLQISNEVYPLIPEGNWKKFFDEIEWRFLGEHFVISYTQQQRLAVAHSSIDGEIITEEFAKCNFNKLLEYLIWCKYLYLTFKLKHNPYPAFILVSLKKFGFDDENFGEELEKLQDAFENVIEVTKSHPHLSADTDGGKQTYLHFSWWNEEYRPKKLSVNSGIVVEEGNIARNTDTEGDLPF